MPAKNFQGLTASSIFTLEDKAISKQLYQLPTSLRAKTIEQVFEQNAHGIVHMCINSYINHGLHPLTKLFVKEFENVEFKQGLKIQDIGFLIAELVKETLKPGDVLQYTLGDEVPIIEDISKYDSQHIRSRGQFQAFQNVESYTEVDKWAEAIALQAEAAAKAIITTLNVFAFSVLLGVEPSSFCDNGVLQHVGGKRVLSDATNHKSGNKFVDDNGEIKKFCKKMSGDFKARFKNVIYYTPQYSNFFDPSGSYVISPPKKLEGATTDEKVKELYQEKYTQKTGANKNNPKKGLTRAISLYALNTLIVTYLRKMTTDADVKNGMGFDPYSTDQNDKGFICQADASNLVLIMNPDDLSEMKNNLNFFAPGGTVGVNFSEIESQLREVIGLAGVDPGTAILMDHRAVNFFKFYEAHKEHENVEHLVKQKYSHVFIRPAIGSQLCGICFVANEFVPSARFMNYFLNNFKNS